MSQFVLYVICNHLVSHRSECHLPVNRTIGNLESNNRSLSVISVDTDLALHRDAGGQLSAGPGAVRLAEDGLPPHHPEPGLTHVAHLTAVVGAGPILDYTDSSRIFLTCTWIP